MKKAVFTDEELLIALHWRDHDGLSTRQIGERLGRTKNAVIGAFTRIERDTDAADVSPHLNGTLGPLWWQNRAATQPLSATLQAKSPDGERASSDEETLP